MFEPKTTPAAVAADPLATADTDDEISGGVCSERDDQADNATKQTEIPGQAPNPAHKYFARAQRSSECEHRDADDDPGRQDMHSRESSTRRKGRVESTFSVPRAMTRQGRSVGRARPEMFTRSAEEPVRLSRPGLAAPTRGQRAVGHQAAAADTCALPSRPTLAGVGASTRFWTGAQARRRLDQQA
jgi:hypothetical protein